MGEVSVYNVRGQLVRRLFTGEIAHGWQRYLWDGRDDRGQTSAAGVYLVRATVGGVKQSRKVTLIR
jgi:flagellar hook assembly protein FlgD